MVLFSVLLKLSFADMKLLTLGCTDLRKLGGALQVMESQGSKGQFLCSQLWAINFLLHKWPTGEPNSHLSLGQRKAVNGYQSIGPMLCETRFYF
jgi:hypothetical protein